MYGTKRSVSYSLERVLLHPLSSIDVSISAFNSQYSEAFKRMLASGYTLLTSLITRNIIIDIISKKIKNVHNNFDCYGHYVKIAVFNVSTLINYQAVTINSYHKLLTNR